MQDPKLCVICQEPLRLIPAGISRKTNKPYQAFFACPNKCKQTPKPSGSNQILMEEIVGFRKEMNERLDEINGLLTNIIKKYEERTE